MGVSHAAARLAVARLARQRLVASPPRGFYVIVPPEYKRLGCLPADQFIPDLIKELQLSYYAGLFTAAQYYGAAHHRTQEFQVVVATNRRPIICGAIGVTFIASNRVTETPVREFNTLRGTIRVSTVEATALDLVGYAHHTGGLEQATTIIADLADQIDPETLTSPLFTSDIQPLLSSGYAWRMNEVAHKVYTQLILLLPGESREGE